MTFLRINKDQIIRKLHSWNIKPLDKALVPSTQIISRDVLSSKINQDWSAEEANQFRIAVLKELSEKSKDKPGVNWSALSNQYSNRSPDALKSRYSRIMNSAQNLKGTETSGKRKQTLIWLPEEDDALRTGVAMYGEGRWVHIANFVQTRNNLQCAYRWRYLNTPVVGHKTPSSYWLKVQQQQNRLMRMTSSSNLPLLAQPSEVVAEMLGAQGEHLLSGTSMEDGGMSILSRYELIHTNGLVMLQPFTPEEDHTLIRLVRLFGTRWTLVANILTAQKLQHKDQDVSSIQRRYAQTVAQRFSSLINPSAIGRLDMLGHPPVEEIKKGKKKPRAKANRWSMEEDQELKDIVNDMMANESGSFSWKTAAQRISKDCDFNQCRNRWVMYLNSNIKTTAFTEEEDKIIWPFVIDKQQRPLTTARKRYYTGSNITTKYDESTGEVGIGWIGAQRGMRRSTLALRSRVKRIQHILQWLHEVAEVPEPQRYFELVHRLANTPSQFRIVKKRSKKI